MSRCRTAAVLAALAVSALALPSLASAQSMPGCAWGPQSLARSIEPDEGTQVRSFTVCPDEAPTMICITADPGFKLKVLVDGQAENPRFAKEHCEAVGVDYCRQVPIEVTTRETDIAVGFHMRCYNGG
jgi:hypothetical protein